MFIRDLTSVCGLRPGVCGAAECCQGMSNLFYYIFILWRLKTCFLEPRFEATSNKQKSIPDTLGSKTRWYTPHLPHVGPTSMHRPAFLRIRIDFIFRRISKDLYAKYTKLKTPRYIDGSQSTHCQPRGRGAYDPPAFDVLLLVFKELKSILFEVFFGIVFFILFSKDFTDCLRSPTCPLYKNLIRFQWDLSARPVVSDLTQLLATELFLFFFLPFFNI